MTISLCNLRAFNTIINLYQTLPIVQVAFLEDTTAFVSHILLNFDCGRLT